MNLLFGLAGDPPANGRYAEALAALGRWYNCEPQTAAQEGSVRVSLARTPDSRVVGRATAGSRTVLLLGSLNRPLAGWRGPGSPLDDPDEAARYLLQRYEAEQLEFLSEVFGAYQVVIVDPERNRLVLGVDPTGLRTFFVREQGGALWFSTALAGLAHAFGPDVGVDRSLEDFFLCHGYYPFHRTCFTGVRLLEPGTVLTWQDGAVSRQRTPQSATWHDRFMHIDWEGRTESEAIDVLHDALLTAMEEQTASEARAAVLLGGFDSALVASMLHRLGKQVETFSFYYDDSRFNQPHTDTLAKELGIKHHWVRISEETLADGIENYARRFNFPTNWMNYVIQTEAVCQHLREAGIRYVYSGDGCDGTFLGYPRTHTFASFLGRTRRLPRWLADGVAHALDNRVVEYHTGRPYVLLLHFLRGLAREMPARGYVTFRVMDENSVRRLRPGSPPPQERDNEALLAQVAAPLAAASMDRLAYAGKNALSPNRSKLAGSSDASGLPICSPYLHHGMKQLAGTIPDSLLRPEDARKRNYMGKYILFRMAEEKKLLPREVIYQPKVSAVDAPVDDWYRGRLSGVLRRKLEHLPFEPNPEYVDFLLAPPALEALHKRFIASDSLTSHALSLLTTYAQFAAAVER